MDCYVTLVTSPSPPPGHCSPITNILTHALPRPTPQFIIGTGDNFYWCGLQNTSDYQIAADWCTNFDINHDSSLTHPSATLLKFKPALCCDYAVTVP